MPGYWADRMGRTTITMASMAISATCALSIGLFYGSPCDRRNRDPVGFAIVADSAQFSACVTELCDREYLGTALTLKPA